MSKTIDLDKTLLKITSEIEEDEELIEQEFLAEVKAIAKEWLRMKKTEEQ